MSNIQTPDAGGKKPGQQNEQNQDDRNQGQNQKLGDRPIDDRDEQDQEKLIDKEAPGQSQPKKKLKQDGDDGMDVGTLGERPMTEETEMDDDKAKH